MPKVAPFGSASARPSPIYRLRAAGQRIDRECGMRRMLANALTWASRVCAVVLIVIAILALIKGDDRWVFSIIGALVCIGYGHIASHLVMVSP